jgi:hypothetical protein
MLLAVTWMALQEEFFATCYKECLKLPHHSHLFVCGGQVGTSCDALLYALGATVSVIMFVSTAINSFCKLELKVITLLHLGSYM